VHSIRQKLGHTTKVEVEIDQLQQLPEVLDAKADIVLLDNMGPETLRKAVTACEGKIITEASGGITLDSIRDIAQSGVDYISVGALTHSIQNLDFGLDIGQQ
jgi:nicotinate-nucleotide pyrophosphorylase (carboxylating)